MESAFVMRTITAVPVIALLAFLVYDEIPTIWVWIGAVIIFTAGTYISYREARLKKLAMNGKPIGAETGAAAA